MQVFLFLPTEGADVVSAPTNGIYTRSICDEN
jgi:hypothetical protein